MAVHTFDDLMQHVGHDVHVSRYISFSEDGTPSTVNVAIECETCYTVLVDFDNPNATLEVHIRTNGETSLKTEEQDA